MALPASRLQRLLSEAPIPFRTGDYISRGLKFMNDNLGMLLAFMLLSGVISAFLQILPVVGIVLSVFITPVLQIGYAQFAYRTTLDRRAEFGEFFKGFNKMGPLVGTYLLTAVVSIVAILPGLILWYQAGMLEWLQGVFEEYPFIQNLPNLSDTVNMTLFWLGVLVMVLAGILVTTIFLWAINLIWFFEVGPMEALTYSRKLISRNWLDVVGFLLVSGLVAASGILLCGVGLLYTVPAMYCAHFFAFADGTRLFETGEDQQDILDHFIA